MVGAELFLSLLLDLGVVWCWRGGAKVVVCQTLSLHSGVLNMLVRKEEAMRSLYIQLPFSIHITYPFPIYLKYTYCHYHSPAWFLLSSMCAIFPHVALIPLHVCSACLSCFCLVCWYLTCKHELWGLAWGNRMEYMGWLFGSILTWHWYSAVSSSSQNHEAKNQQDTDCYEV